MAAGEKLEDMLRIDERRSAKSEMKLRRERAKSEGSGGECVRDNQRCQQQSVVL